MSLNIVTFEQRQYKRASVGFGGDQNCRFAPALLFPDRKDIRNTAACAFADIDQIEHLHYRTVARIGDTAGTRGGAYNQRSRRRRFLRGARPRVRDDALADASRNKHLRRIQRSADGRRTVSGRHEKPTGTLKNAPDLGAFLL